MRTKDGKIGVLSRKLSLFTDPVRLKLFLFLFNPKQDDLCVSDIAEYLGSSLSNVSHQLRKLELAGVVEPKREGRMICYRIRTTKENQILYNSLYKLMRLE